MKHFNGKSFYSVSSKRKSSMIDTFEDDEKLIKVIRNRLGITYKDSFPVTGAMLRQGFRSMRLGANASTFNSVVAKAVYESFCEPGDITWDISCGFGQRMLAAISAGVLYRGCDPWKDVIDGNKMMSEFVLGKSSSKEFDCECRLVCMGSEDDKVLDSLGIKEQSVKLVFSSPPYYDIEIYDNGSPSRGQSAALGKTFDSYISTWWIPTLKNVYKSLKPKDGRFIVNMTRPMVDRLVDVANKHGFEVVDEQTMKLKRGHFSISGSSSDASEPFIVLKAIAPSST